MDDLDYDYMREYLKSTSNRLLTDSLSKLEIANTLKLFTKNEFTTNNVTNFAVLMFSDKPEKFIPYSYIEIISKSVF